MKSRYCSDEDQYIYNYLDNMSKVRPDSNQIKSSSIDHKISADNHLSSDEEQDKSEERIQTEPEVIKIKPPNDINDDEEFIIDIDKKSFSNAHIEVHPDSVKANINKNKTCHELTWN